MQQQLFSNTRVVNLVISILGAFLFWQAASLLADLTAGTGLHPMFRVIGGSGVAFVKILAYLTFIFGVLELRERSKQIAKEEQGFHFGLLPTQEQLVLTPEEVEQIKHETLKMEQKGQFFFVSSIIKKTCTQYRNDNNIGDTMQALDAHLDASQKQQEGQLETVRYIIQTVPMLGFIGTIIELTASLRLVKNFQKTGDITEVSNALYSAFDATLVALGLTIILTFLYHRHIENLDVFFARIKAYIMDNLVSRIYNR